MKDSLAKISKEIKKCKKCRLYKQAIHGVPGEGSSNAKIFLIGQSPGAQENKTGKPFVGRAGKFLTQLLSETGLKRKDVFITSAVKHHPPKNRAPKKDEINACKPYLLRQITIIKPKIIVLLGKTAESTEIKAKHIIKTAHPSAAMRFPKMKKRIKKDFKRLKKML